MFLVSYRAIGPQVYDTQDVQRQCLRRLRGSGPGRDFCAQTVRKFLRTDRCSLHREKFFSDKPSNSSPFAARGPLAIRFNASVRRTGRRFWATVVTKRQDVFLLVVAKRVEAQPRSQKIRSLALSERQAFRHVRRQSRTKCPAGPVNVETPGHGATGRERRGK
jgi:hypothetical protein